MLGFSFEDTVLVLAGGVMLAFCIYIMMRP